MGSIPLRVTKGKENRIVGANDGEGPPVPIPNTEVKLARVEDTWLETARENRKMPTQTEVLSFKQSLCFFVPEKLF